VFQEYSTEALVQVVDRALSLYRDRRRWRRLMRNGMRQDWTWERSAAEYVRVYEMARQRLSRRVGIAAAE
jgi:starch synthase